MTPQEALATALVAAIKWWETPVDPPVGREMEIASEFAAAILDALPEGAYLVVPPPNTRLILAAEDLLAAWGTRTAEGYAITAEWGEQTPEGWYEPRFTAHSDDDLAANQREVGAQQERERLREAVREALTPQAPSDLSEWDFLVRETMEADRDKVLRLLADPEDDR